jgi:hypothetical protein
MVVQDPHWDYIRALRKIKSPQFARRTETASTRSRRGYRIVTAILAMGFLAGCAGPRLEPMEGPSASETTLAEAGIRLTIYPNAWSGFPADLSRYFTPLAVRIENQRSEEIQVRYEDFIALDGDRIQYRALPPTEVARVLTGSHRHQPQPGQAPPFLLAGGPWPWYPYQDPFFYPYYPYYPYGYLNPYYPYAWPPRTGADILTLALREGRILPRASIQGFLYLQLATARGNSLALSWTARSSDGIPLTTLNAQFRIVR